MRKSAKGFTPASMIRLSCVLRAQPITRDRRKIVPRENGLSAQAATKGQGPQDVGLRRRKLRLHVTSAKALVISQGSVQNDYEKMPIL